MLVHIGLRELHLIPPCMYLTLPLLQVGLVQLFYQLEGLWTVQLVVLQLVVVLQVVLALSLIHI